MPSNDDIVREYIQGDIKNGQIFDDRYVDRMETGIEAGFKYSNYLEEHIENDINNTKEELTQYTDNAKAEAIAHTNSEIAKTRTDLTAYTDAAKAEAKTYTKNSINNLRTELQEYTDTAESDANKYTDTKISTLSNTTATNISNALKTAKDYTDTEVAELKTYSEQYATGIKNDLLNGAGGAYDTLKELGDLIDNNTDAIDALDKVAASKAPINHASTATTYGIGTGSNYGHVKLSDSVSSSSAASAGIAASPKAVKSAYEEAISAKNNSIIELTINGKNITYQKGDGTENTLITQDTTYQVVTNTEDGLVPKFDKQSGIISPQDTYTILTAMNGMVGWYKLPKNAFLPGNEIMIEPTFSSGIKINSITVDGITKDIYIPESEIITTDEINNICK